VEFGIIKDSNIDRALTEMNRGRIIENRLEARTKVKTFEMSTDFTMIPRDQSENYYIVDESDLSLLD